MKRLVAKYLKRLARRQRDQRYLERIRDIAYAGMNIGGGGDLRTSGELGVLDHVRVLGRAAPVVLDVGANRGLYALAARRLLGPGARVIAFEPGTQAGAHLEEAVRGTGIEIVRLALGDVAGTATLHADEAGSGLGSLYPREIDHLDVRMVPAEEVPVSTLDEECASRGVDAIALLKLDVEGHELAVLHGARNLLARSAIDCIQFEFGGCNLDSRTYFRDFHRLLSPGYRLFRILRGGFREIEAYDERIEVFTTTNYLACRRDVPAPSAGVEG